MIEVERGDLDEAERWIDIAEQTGSPDDRATAIGIELARGLRLAALGEARAEGHLRRALELVDETDCRHCASTPVSISRGGSQIRAPTRRRSSLGTRSTSPKRKGNRAGRPRATHP
jgi:hypothetical protein